MSSNSSRIEFQHTLNSSNFSCANTSNRKPNVFIQSSSNSGECLTGANKQVSLPDALYNCRDPNERPKSSHHSHRQSLQSSQKQQAPNSLSLEENNAMNPISIDDSDDQTFSNASAASDLQQLNIDELDDEPNDNRDSDYVSTLKNKPPRKQRSDLSSCAGSSARGRGKTGRKRAAAKETSVNVISFYDKPSSQQLSYTTTLFEDDPPPLGRISPSTSYHHLVRTGPGRSRGASRGNKTRAPLPKVLPISGGPRQQHRSPLLKGLQNRNTHNVSKTSAAATATSHSPLPRTGGASRKLFNISGTEEILKSASGGNNRNENSEAPATSSLSGGCVFSFPAPDPYRFPEEDLDDTNGNNNEPSKSGTGWQSEPSWGDPFPRSDGTSSLLSSTSQGLGFSNLGNTCYMNAVLQSILGLEPFVRDVEALYQRAKRIAPLPSESLVYNFHRLILIRQQALVKAAARRRSDDEVSRLTGNLVGNLDLFQSQALKHTLLGVKNAIGEKSKLFFGCGQQDAHEFLCQVLDRMKEEFQQFGDASRPTAERSAILVSAAAASSASSASSSSPAAPAAALSGERERERRLLGAICENDDGDPVAQRLVSLATSAFTQMDSMLLPGERGSGSRDENDPLPDTETSTSTAASSTRPVASRPATVSLAASAPQHPGRAIGQPAVAGPPPPDPTTLQFGFGMLVTRECTNTDTQSNSLGLASITLTSASTTLPLPSDSNSNSSSPPSGEPADNNNNAAAIVNGGCAPTAVQNAPTIAHATGVPATALPSHLSTALNAAPYSPSKLSLRVDREHLPQRLRALLDAAEPPGEHTSEPNEKQERGTAGDDASIAASFPICSLQDALDAFMQPELVEGLNCESCLQTVRVKIVRTFTAIPRILMLHVKRYQYSTGSEKVARPLLIPRYLTLAMHCTEATREPTADSLSATAPDCVEADDDSESNSPPPEPSSASAATSGLSASASSSATSSRNNEHHFGKVIVPAQLQTGTSTTSSMSTASGAHSRMPSSSGHPSPHSRTGVKPIGMMPIEFDRANAAAFTTTTTTTTATCAGVRPTACVNGTASTAMSTGSSGDSMRAPAPSSASSTCSKTGENLFDDPAAEEAEFAEVSPPQALSSRPLSSKPSLMSGVGRGTPCSSTMSRTNANPNPASRSYAGVAAGSGQSAGQSRAPGSLFALTLEPHSSRQNTDSSGLSTSNRLGSSEEAWDAFESRSAAGGPRTSSNNQANLKWQQDKTAQDASELDNLTRNDDHFMDASTSSGHKFATTQQEEDEQIQLALQASEADFDNRSNIAADAERAFRETDYLDDDDFERYMASHQLDGANDSDSPQRRTGSRQPTALKTQTSEPQPERVNANTRSMRISHPSASDATSRSSDSPDIGRKRKPGPLSPTPHVPPSASRTASQGTPLPPPPPPHLHHDGNLAASPSSPASAVNARHLLPDLLLDSLPPKRSKSESGDLDVAHVAADARLLAAIATPPKSLAPSTSPSPAVANAFKTVTSVAATVSTASSSPSQPTSHAIESRPLHHLPSLVTSSHHAHKEGSSLCTASGGVSQYFAQSAAAETSSAVRTGAALTRSICFGDDVVSASSAQGRKSRTNSEPSAATSSASTALDCTFSADAGSGFGSGTAGGADMEVTNSEPAPSPKPAQSEQMRISREELYSDPQLLQNMLRNYEEGHLPSSYRLVSVVSHLGSTAAAGHYVSDVRDSSDTSGSRWCTFDDRTVDVALEDTVRLMRQTSGYIFFYLYS